MASILLGSCLGSCLGLMGFAIYVETSPKMGGIWLRPDDQNNLRILPYNLWILAKQPLVDNKFWKTENWDLNVFFWIGGGALFGSGFLLIGSTVV